jgi:hypothetical protein
VKRAIAVIALVLASIAGSIGANASGVLSHQPAAPVTHVAGDTNPPLPDGSSGQGGY